MEKGREGKRWSEGFTNHKTGIFPAATCSALHRTFHTHRLTHIHKAMLPGSMVKWSQLMVEDYSGGMFTRISRDDLGETRKIGFAKKERKA